jgi:hypothetical protein
MPGMAARARCIVKRACDDRAADSCRHPKKDSHGKRFLLARWFSRDHMFSQALRLTAR